MSPDLSPAAWTLLATCGLVAVVAAAARIGPRVRERREVRLLLRERRAMRRRLLRGAEEWEQQARAERDLARRDALRGLARGLRAAAEEDRDGAEDGRGWWEW